MLSNQRNREEDDETYDPPVSVPRATSSQSCEDRAVALPVDDPLAERCPSARFEKGCELRTSQHEQCGSDALVAPVICELRGQRRAKLGTRAEAKGAVLVEPTR